MFEKKYVKKKYVGSSELDTRRQKCLKVSHGLKLLKWSEVTQVKWSYSSQVRLLKSSEVKFCKYTSVLEEWNT
jgi:hypothetical protein